MPKESAVREPRTEAGREYLSIYPDDGANRRRHIILAIEDQAATEARRELLAALEGLPQSDVGAMYPAGWNAALAAVLRLIEERP